ncbi:MAG TPA: UDP-3-O-(3-hydroxymyristoyl)glucosamine N-acyltransferase [Candidatus Eremiobacteraceae bacterium]|nr:UDP-3-O-(3-hydroxymyristoyl)glucosamine N-acyltransferase [Candidatus Eremiobacteraceae bacterium]
MADACLRDLATLTKGVVVGDADATIDRVAAVDDADAKSLTFAVDERWLEKALRSRAGAVLVPAGAERVERNGKSLIVVENVRAALAAVLHSFAPKLPAGEFTHSSAVIASEVQRAPDVWIGAGVIVCYGAVLGQGCTLLGGSYVGAGTRIGARTLLHPHATVLDECIVGDDCVLQSGCVIGSDGFGFVRVGAEQIKIPQIGNVVLGDRVEIGAATTIDRAVTGSTIIGSGTKIDNQVQIGHNVQIGEDCTICAQTGIAGSTKLGNRVTAGGQVGMVGHIEIGDGTIMGAGSKVIGSLPPNSFVSGDYAMPHRENIEQKVLLRKLPKLFDQVRTLMNALDESRKSK